MLFAAGRLCGLAGGWLNDGLFIGDLAAEMAFPVLVAIASDDWRVVVKCQASSDLV